MQMTSGYILYLIVLVVLVTVFRSMDINVTNY